MAKKNSNNQAEEELKKRTANVSNRDWDTVLNNEEDLNNKTEVGPLLKFVSDIKLMFNLVGDFASKKYTDIPLATVITVVAALGYVISPIDLIPDFIPVLGLTDDAAMVALALGAISFDLAKYKKWKKNH